MGYDEPRRKQLSLFYRTEIRRFVSLNGFRLVHIRRYETDGTYSNPCADEDQKDTWAVCLDTEPDVFSEYGSFENTLRRAAEPRQIAGAAMASPRGFADMLTAAYDLGWVIAVGSPGRLAMGDGYEDPTRFTRITVLDDAFHFFTWRGSGPSGERVASPGIYKNTFSLTDLRMDTPVLVASPPRS